MLETKSKDHQPDRVARLMAPVWRFCTPRRLRAYPRLMLIAVGAIVVAHILLRQGWQGGLGQIIGSDFITLVSAGQLYWTDPSELYDYQQQYAVQQLLISPTLLPGLNPYISPPYVAMAYGALARMPLEMSFTIWTILTLAAVVMAAYLTERYLIPDRLRGPSLSVPQLVVLVMSSFAFVEGVIVGQNHGVTLLLATAVAVFSLRGRWWLAGLCGGLLIYKPHFVLGFLVIWLVWRRNRALVAFAATAAVWLVVSLATSGADPYRAYLGLSDALLGLPYVDGFPAYLMVTPSGLLSTLLPQAAAASARALSLTIALGATGALLAIAWRYRAMPDDKCGPALAAGLLYPLLVAPYTLLHDLVLLLPVFALLSHIQGHRRALLCSAAVSYVGMLLLTFIGQQMGVALVALIPLGVSLAHYGQVWRNGESSSS